MDCHLMNNKRITDSGSMIPKKIILPLLIFTFFSIINNTIANPLPVTGNILWSGMDKNIRIVQLEARPQKGGTSCGYNAIFNAHAIQEIFDSSDQTFDADFIKALTDSLFEQHHKGVDECALAMLETISDTHDITEADRNILHKIDLLGTPNSYIIHSTGTNIKPGGALRNKDPEWKNALENIKKRDGVCHVICHIGPEGGGHWVYIGIIKVAHQPVFILYLDSMNGLLINNSAAFGAVTNIYKKLYPDSNLKNLTKSNVIHSFFFKHKEKSEEPKSYPRYSETSLYFDKPTTEYPDFQAEGSVKNEVYPQKKVIAPPEKTIAPKKIAPSQTYTLMNKIKIKIVLASILEQSGIDAIVNAANTNLAHTGGIAKIISLAAGEQLKKVSTRFIDKYGPVPVGEAVISNSYDLSKKGIKKIIHAVGPDCRNKEEQEQFTKLLTNAYTNALSLATEHNLTSIAFPAISTAIFACPFKKATLIAIKTVLNFLSTNQTSISEVRFVLIDQDNYDEYIKQFDAITKNPKLLKPKKVRFAPKANQKE